jgi:predicted membrane-bound mannosyltransferase
LVVWIVFALVAVAALIGSIINGYEGAMAGALGAFYPGAGLICFTRPNEDNRGVNVLGGFVCLLSLLSLSFAIKDGSPYFTTMAVFGFVICAGLLIANIYNASTERSGHRETVERHLETLAATPSTEIVMGDVYRDIKNSTIVNRSVLTDSMNHIAGRDPELASAIGTLAIAVHQSGNKKAGELFDQFSEELGKGQPRKSVLQVCWEGIQNALPTVTAVAETAGAISKLF